VRSFAVSKDTKAPCTPPSAGKHAAARTDASGGGDKQREQKEMMELRTRLWSSLMFVMTLCPNCSEVC
jgi:hypothetical protein